MEKLIEKLKKILGKLGVEEEKINSIVEEVQSEDAPEEDNPSDPEPVKDEPTPTDDSTPEPEPTPLPDEPVNVPEGNGEPVPTDEPAPVEDVPAPVQDEGGEPLPPNPTLDGEVNPADIVPEPTDDPLAQQPVDPTIELQAKVDSQSELIDSLKARIDSLESALKTSGIMDEEVATSEAGLDNPRTPANNPIDDPLASVLGEINGRRHG